MTTDKTELTAYLTDYRKKLESVWCEATASADPNLRPLEGKPISTGQCSASSLVLQDDLQKKFGPLDLKIALGKVWVVEQRTWAIPIHVWLQLYTSPYNEPLLIDLAADQAMTIDEKIICETARSLIDKQGYIYVVDNLFQNEIKPQTRKRADLLRKLLNSSVS